MASRNGLNPKLRGSKGRGFNRALPAAFGFDKGIWPDSVDDYLTAPGIVGKPIPNQLTIEFWLKYPVEMDDFKSIFGMTAVGGQEICAARNYQLSIQTRFAAQGGSINTVLPSNTRKTMICYTINLETAEVYSYQPNAVISFDTKSNLSNLMGKSFETLTFFIGGFGMYYGSAIIDEFRIHNKILNMETYNNHYNNGVGNNPYETESLLVWYKFEQFEFLDFSNLQDASDIRLGIRDLSGNNSHLQQFNMDTNPASIGYVLKPFN